MIDVQKVNETKEKIITVLKTAGPSFPTRISREAGINPLFIGALLSEMVAEKRVYMSAMKVGSSPLYFTKGQEPLLENFTQYLNSKEQEAFSILKDSQILQDEAEDPAIRVALRKIKDFAIPMTIREEDKEHLFWKHFTVTDDQAQTLIEKKLNPVKAKAPEPVVEKKEPVVVKEEVHESVKKEEKKKKKAEPKTSTFGTKIKEYLATKEIHVLADLPSKAKEYNARVSINTPLGKQEYLLTAKEKKKLTEDDIALAVHRAQTEKMPAFLLTTGDLDKAAVPYFEQWKNLVKLDRLTL